MLGFEPRRPLDCVLVVDEGEDRLDGRLVVADRPQGQRHGLVHNLEHPAAGQLLVLHQRDVGLDAGGVAVHQEGDRAGRGEHGGLGVAEAMRPATGEHVVPDLPGRLMQIPRAGGVDRLDRVAVHLHHLEHRLAIGREALEGADRGGEFGARAIGSPVEDRRQGPAQPSSGGAVVGQAVGHQQAAEV